MNNKALVIGANHQNPLGVIEALGRVGIHPYVIIYDKCESSFVLKSKYIAKGWICGTKEDVVRTILENFTDTNTKAVAFACCDDISNLLNENYDRLVNYLYIPSIPKQGSLSSWMDKENMVEVAQSLCMNIPATWLVENKQIPDEVEYPCVTKSLSSVDNGKSEFSFCNNRDELQYFLNTQVHSSTIQVQKFIEMNFEFQYLGCSLNEGKEIIIPGRTHIEVTSDFNNLTFLKYQKEKVVEDPTTLSKTESFVRQTSYSGLFSIEFMHGKDEKDYFLEMNFRNDGNGIVVTESGTNLPYIWYLYCSGGDYIKELALSDVMDTYMMPEDSYFLSMIKGNLKYREWRRNLKQTNCFLTYFKEDKRPFWSLINWQKKSIAMEIRNRLLRDLHIYNLVRSIKHIFK